jgi:hypothetical protein
MFLLCVALLLGPTFEARVQAYVSARDMEPALVEGAIFARADRELFRSAVRDLLTLEDVAVLREETRSASTARVDAALPSDASHYVPARLLFRFPPLPPPIEYRIVNADLVLWDVDADVVIDVLRELFVVPAYASRAVRSAATLA